MQADTTARKINRTLREGQALTRTLESTAEAVSSGLQDMFACNILAQLSEDSRGTVEILLAEDKKMAPEKVRGFTQKEAPENNQINLSRRIPVHITYFTASVDPAGKVTTFKDVYGHEERVSLGLDGKMHLIQPVPEVKGPSAAEPVGQLAEIKTNEKDWARAVFSGGN